jgi:signal transduction histidine kinase/CheY-like chemotaxis protein
MSATATTASRARLASFLGDVWQWHYFASVIALAAVYFAFAKIGLHFALVHPSSTAVWPPTGVAFAALLLGGRRLWPGIFIGALLANLTTAGSLATSIGIATGNTLEALAGAWLADRFANGRNAFNRARDIFKFAILAGLLSTAISATFGVTSLALGGYARWAHYETIWLTWWLGDLGGALIVTPLLVTWIENPIPEGIVARPFEAIAMLLSIVVSALAVFAGLLPPALRSYAIPSLCIPSLLWVAFRFSQNEAALAVALLSAIAVWGTLHGFGPFVRVTPNVSLLLLHMSADTAAVMTLAVAAIVSERRRAEADLVAANSMLRRLHESERAARKAAETSNLAKDQFLAMLGHELRNPLGAISNAAQILEQTGSLDSRAASARAIVSRQARHLTRLVDELLDLARVTSGRIALRCEPTNLAEVAAACVDALRTADKPLDIRTETEAVWVNGDPDRLAQITSNLISNAIRYTPAGGSIVVATRAEGERAVIQVTDTGAGIPAELLPRIFALFVQGESGLARPAGGLGIGLTLVRRLAELHGGSVEAASDGPGCGSQFTVRIPRVPAPAGEARLPTAAAAGGMRRRVLLIDDNADLRESLRALLELLGHEVHEYADGERGIDAALTLSPDVALIDIGLPVVDGYQVARRIRHAPEGRGILLVALSGYGQPEHRREAQAAGFDAYLVKPVDMEELGRLVARPMRAAG